MAEEKNQNGKKEKEFTRRDFLKTTGVATGGVIGGSLLGGLVGFNLNETPSLETESENERDSAENGESSGHTDSHNFNDARMYLSRNIDFETLAAASERIYPQDDNGPGAIELGVPYFIDRQMAGQWGSNAKEYMQGPFAENPEELQGYQSSMTRAEIIVEGLRKLNETSQSENEIDFPDLDGGRQDEILTMFEAGDVDMEGLRDSNVFFDILRAATLEGVYSDPLYGGNRNMEGWRMKEYPGAYPAYIDVIEQEEFFEAEPVSLSNHH